MSEKVKGITIRTEYLDGLLALSDEQRGKLLLALFADSGCGDMPELDTVTELVFKLVIPSVRIFQSSYARHAEARAENGRKGGRPPKKENLETEHETEKPIGFEDNQSVYDETECETEKPKSTTELNLTELNNTPIVPQRVSDLPPSACEAMTDFIQYRREKKNPMTDRAISAAINKLHKLFGMDYSLWKASVEQSIMNNWTGLFPVKEDTGYDPMTMMPRN